MTGWDVVVVGGGILGCSAAHHLRERGASVCIVEAGRVGGGTTSAGGGFVAAWAAGAFPGWSEEELAFERYGLDFYRGMAADGLDVGLNETGSLWLAVTEAGWDAHLRPIAEHTGVADRETVTPAEVERLTGGVVSASGVVGGVLHPGGIHVTTTLANGALAARCERAGVEIREHESVTAIRLAGTRAVGVDTAAGPIDAGAVVVAAGAWSRPLLRTAGYDAPMVPLAATRLISEPVGVPAELPTLMVEELSFLWVRGDHGSLLWGCEYEVPPRYDFVGTDPPFGSSEIDGGQAVEATLAVGRSASGAIPLLGRTMRHSVAHGLPCYTADLRALVGPVPGVDGLFLLGGDNQAGVTHGPGYGRLMAALVTEPGDPPPEARAFRPDRFGDADPAGIAAMAAGHIFELSEQDAAGPSGVTRR